MFNNKKTTVMIASFLVFILFLIGCNDESNDSKVNENSETEPVSEESLAERTMTDAMDHEVTIPANPERVIASYLEDHLIALDVMPVTQWSINDGAGVQDYLQEYLKDIPMIPSELPFEVVTSYSPDLIIMGSAQAVEGEKYEQYNKIAPTFVVEEENNGDWRKQFVAVGDIFGKTEEAKKVLEEYEEKAAASKKVIQDAIGSESAAAIWLVNNNFYIVSENVSSGAVLYGDLGLETPSIVKEISSTATGNWSAISLERLAELDADHLFLINSDKGNGAEMLKDPLWGNIPAVKNSHIYEYDSTTSWLYAGPIANSQMIDHIVESLTK